MGKSEDEGHLYEYLVGIGAKDGLERVGVRIRVILAWKEGSPNSEVEVDGIAGTETEGKDEVNSREG